MKKNERSSIRQVAVRRIRQSEATNLSDAVAVEEPLEIRLLYWFKDAQLVQSLGLTMRTPGNDRELALGFLLSEGVIEDRGDVVEIRHLGGEPSDEVLVELARHVDAEGWRLSRASYVNSSCGVCGKRSRDSIARPPDPEVRDRLSVKASALTALPQRLQERQAGFSTTGGLHAAALATRSGDVVTLFEDVGRHNALDKLLGWCLGECLLPLTEHVVFLSSRNSFELVQKLIMAGGRMIATIGAPSSLAIETARAYGITLVGFIRESRFNVYSGEWRINL